MTSPFSLARAKLIRDNVRKGRTCLFDVDKTASGCDGAWTISLSPLCAVMGRPYSTEFHLIPVTDVVLGERAMGIRSDG